MRNVCCSFLIYGECIDQYADERPLARLHAKRYIKIQGVLIHREGGK